MKKQLALQNVHTQDPEIAAINDREEQNQMETISLIPSQNYTSVAVRETYSSVFTNKYSEGYPNARYYPDNTHVDEVELITQKRALALFGLSEKEWGVNVQPYSGSPANLAIYTALLKPDDTALGMSLTEGGHLTHGHKASSSGKFFSFQQYGVDKDGYIDFDGLEALAQEHKPKAIICGASAYSRTIDFEKFAAIARAANAYLIADISHIAGLIAAGLHPSPFEWADVVMTTTHKTLRGPRGAVIFARLNHMSAINKAVMPGIQGGPHNNTTAAIAVALKEAQQPVFQQYAQQVIKNAATLVNALQKKEFTIVSGGTDNHLFLIDCTQQNLSGTEAEQLLESVGIAANRNTIPSETRSAFDPSGIRMGTPCVTTRGMREPEMERIAEAIHNAFTRQHTEKTKEEMRALAQQFPPPGFSFS
ncbi:MAG: serine hydroxymethyltransferase [Candidatus Spechtbacteria bacterium SB0662_bin_43]|uniref:Serine hydroxymethyltransferase n=1 Tax=Candidatus Spechtbacteria bacterium SB0662_bin_43 TaxID=2604897 RepID=A0A845DB98_9BACT|nr:serine hydroxymethyltransferase [Candidatus Spechtbacteria bacterium SB0662_bin_43]